MIEISSHVFKYRDLRKPSKVFYLGHFHCIAHLAPFLFDNN